jgi:hypothetical protein
MYVINPDNTLRSLEVMQKINITSFSGRKRHADVRAGYYTAFNKCRSQPTIEREAALIRNQIYARKEIYAE